MAVSTEMQVLVTCAALQCCREGEGVCWEQHAERCGKRVERWERRKELGYTAREERKETERVSEHYDGL